MKEYRTETDLIGVVSLPAESLSGIHTARAMENFPLTGRPLFPSLIQAYGSVKLACAMANRELGVWQDNPAKADAIIQASTEVSEGLLNQHVSVDALQGGAGTSTNMCVNEVIANRALKILGRPPGDYETVSPNDDINRHQSTNDTYPTALKLAAIRQLHHLEDQIVHLLEAFQTKEKEFAHIVKVARTQLQDAVLTTLGREMGAYAEALSRDRWRIYKCEERLRVVNLGGTAIGTGLTSPRKYIFRVTEILREMTGIGFARAENLVENTQNADVFVEVSGILKALSTTLYKLSSDLRLLSSGPEAGLNEINLPQRQAGSSIMPGKVNPVIPEAVTQVAMLTMGYDSVIANACAAGCLELNPFLPLVANCLLENISLLTNACDIFRRLCVEGITANEQVCQSHVAGCTSTITALLPKIGYEKATELVAKVCQEEGGVRQAVVEMGLMTAAEFDELISPEAVNRLGNKTEFKDNIE